MPAKGCKPTSSRACEAIGCERAASRLGLCERHYAQERRGRTVSRRGGLPPPSPVLPAGTDPIDLHEQLLKKLQDPEWIRSFPPDQIRALAAGAAEIRRKRDADIAIQRLVPPAEVAGMLRAHAELFLREAGERAPASWAAAILDAIRRVLGDDLRSKHPSLESLLANALAVEINGTVKRISDLVDLQTRDLETRL